MQFTKACLLALAVSTSSLVAQEDTNLEFEAGVDYVTDYIWRGFTQSKNTNYQPWLNWSTGNWSGSFWGTYDTGTQNYINDFSSDWLKVDSSFAYTWRQKKSSFELGYIYYAFHDDYFDTHEIYGKYTWEADFNPIASIYYDFDFNKGAYVSLDLSKSKKDRNWEYEAGVNFGYLSGFGETGTDIKKINGITQAPFGLNSYSGMAAINPRIVLKKHLDDESTFSLSLTGNIIPNKDTYKNIETDTMVWGMSYALSF
ncbi:MAG: hypothetical protein COB02_14930 [Candidatus Cloacimonadota bacterium]|nr:MAG: hypothetical protein COB02_14930 [Candidatus Cloacimonadota bacterium]